MKKIDRRRHYHLVVDVETAGGFGNPLVYDIGYAITDRHGKIYATRSFIIKEIFEDKNLMNTAYYSEKVPMYLEDISKGKRKVVNFMEMRKDFLELAIKYRIKSIKAYNLEFDMNAITNTIRYILSDDSIKFLTEDFIAVEMDCIWCLACETLYTQKSFGRMATRNGWLTDAGNYRTSAEIGYRFITGDVDFIESHTGLEDVLIEIEIMAYALRQRKGRTAKMFAHPWRLVQD